MSTNIALKLPIRNDRLRTTARPSAGLLWATAMTALLLAGLVGIIGL